ncbi:hypothetical protein I4F81_010957 [Pyropia yezoensis]|uniref:Uncharacterized protein n=1 Tax=Pyropia yezoensis TaxID=2788 RepID=A0ACC3CE34_PYRYE|nr:hypothetical protein I4F81_010957 [Neopyropia yezoensis]|eukprot:contig_27829_g6852
MAHPTRHSRAIPRSPCCFTTAAALLPLRRRGGAAVRARPLAGSPRTAPLRRATLTASADAPTALSPELAATLQQVAADRDEALASVTAADNLPALDAVRVAFLGKKGRLTAVLKTLGKLNKEDRPAVGGEVNAAKDVVASAVAARKEVLVEEARAEAEAAEEIDVTMPGVYPRRLGYKHPINSTIDRALDIFEELGYSVIDDPKLTPEVETEYYCFGALNCAEDHPARDMQDTFYITDPANPEGENLLLRSQTSSVQIRYMEQNKPPFAVIAPGRVYRRDTVDATHSAMFHQIEILAVAPMGELNLGGLKGTVTHFLEQMLGTDIEVRFRGSFFPFTEPSMEVDVLFRGKWLEILGCGMVDPAVLTNVGIDPEKYAGFAAGFGVERFAMIMHDIPDIRMLYQSDWRFLSQFMQD